MSKVNLNNLTSLQNEASAISIINNNNDAIETFSDDVLSRTGKTPNTMESQLDMNSNHLINLPEPVVGTEPVRLQDIETMVDPSQTGNVTSIATTSGGEGAIFSGNTGKVISKYTGNGIVKANAGVLSNAIQGTDFYQPGGTDVAVADGGTGASTALAGFNNLKQPATSSYVGAVQLATTTEANTGTDTAKAVTAAGVAAYYNGHINTSLSPYSKILRTFSSFPSANASLALTDQGNIVIPSNTSDRFHSEQYWQSYISWCN